MGKMLQDVSLDDPIFIAASLLNKYWRPAGGLRDKVAFTLQSHQLTDQTLFCIYIAVVFPSCNVPNSPSWSGFSSPSCSSLFSSAPVSPWTSTPRNALKSTGGLVTAAVEPLRCAGGSSPCTAPARFKAASVASVVDGPVFAAVRTKEPSFYLVLSD